MLTINRGLFYIGYMKTSKHLIDVKYVSDINKKVSNDKSESNSKSLSGNIAYSYKPFRNEDSSIILDINDEKFNLPFIENEIETTNLEGINTNRGITGVYEIEDLIEVLRRENAKNIFVTSVPPDWKYVDYICLVSGRSHRHMLAIAEFVRKIYKIKRNPRDYLPKIEGKDSKEWLAMDLGNIALHIFSEEGRAKYDLDSLWSVGEEYDDECNKPSNPVIQLLQQHLKDLQPADSNT